MKHFTTISFLTAAVFFYLWSDRPVRAEESQAEYLERIGVCPDRVDEFGQYPPCGYPFCRPKREDGIYTNTEGPLYIQYAYQDGKVEGPFRVYRIDSESKDKLDNRFFLQKYRYVKGVREGTQKVYDSEKGYLSRQCEYKDGKIKTSIDYSADEKETMRRGFSYADAEDGTMPQLSRYQKYAADGSVTEELKDDKVKYYVNGNVDKEETLEAKVEREHQEKLEAELDKRKLEEAKQAEEEKHQAEVQQDILDTANAALNAENAGEGWKKTK